MRGVWPGYTKTISAPRYRTSSHLAILRIKRRSPKNSRRIRKAGRTRRPVCPACVWKAARTGALRVRTPVRERVRPARAWRLRPSKDGPPQKAGACGIGDSGGRPRRMRAVCVCPDPRSSRTGRTALPHHSQDCVRQDAAMVAGDWQAAGGRKLHASQDAPRRTSRLPGGARRNLPSESCQHGAPLPAAERLAQAPAPPPRTRWQSRRPGAGTVATERLIAGGPGGRP